MFGFTLSDAERALLGDYLQHYPTALLAALRAPPAPTSLPNELRALLPILEAIVEADSAVPTPPSFANWAAAYATPSPSATPAPSEYPSRAGTPDSYRMNLTVC